jgi:hypothetical protein
MAALAGQFGVEGESAGSGVGYVDGVHELLGVLPDLGRVGSEGEPEADQVGLLEASVRRCKVQEIELTKRRTAAQKYMSDLTVDW